MPTDSQQLESFVRLGREILSCDWSNWYGSDYSLVAPSPPGVGFAQPGFLGSDYRGVVFIGQNPGVGAGRDNVHREWERVFRAWHGKGTVGAYSETYELWKRDLPAWTVWTTYIKPVLNRLGFSEENIGYLNLCKNATTGNARPTANMFRCDWEWTRQQIDLLKPRVIVAGGKDVARQVNMYWQSPFCQVLFQNRARARVGLTYSALLEERDREADTLAAEIRAAVI